MPSKNGVNVFMEKPITVDGPTTRRMFALGEEAAAAEPQGRRRPDVPPLRRPQANCSTASSDGQIGDITLLRAYRMAGPIGFFASPPKPDNISELMYQIQRFHSFLWASGGCFSDFYIHNIDECCWMKDAWPVCQGAPAAGTIAATCVDQNFDSYSVEYTFADGTKMFLEGRTMPGCHDEFASYAHGTRGSAVISTRGMPVASAASFAAQNPTNGRHRLAGRPKRAEPNPYQLEWNHLIDAIRNNRPYNEVAARRRGQPSHVDGPHGSAYRPRRDAHQMPNQHELAPTIDRLTLDSDAPLASVDKQYPVPQPGILTNREY